MGKIKNTNKEDIQDMICTRSGSMIPVRNNMLNMVQRFGNTVIGNKFFKTVGEENLIEYFKSKGMNCIIKKMPHEENKDINYIIERQDKIL